MRRAVSQLVPARRRERPHPRAVAGLPAGSIGGLEFAPWGPLGFTLTSAKSPSDAYSLDPATLQVTRWTESETGGLDPNGNVEPELVEVKSFDGEAVSGFLYRPDPGEIPRQAAADRQHPRRARKPDRARLPRPQQLSDQRARDRDLLPERARLVGLRQALRQPRQRAVQARGFASRTSAPSSTAWRPIRRIDGGRMSVTGGSYGGYMCYASAIIYADRFKGALCNVAISNFVTFLENTQSYRRDLRRVEYGDERDPKQRAKLLEISPLRRIAEIKAPLVRRPGRQRPARAQVGGRPDRQGASGRAAPTSGISSARMKATASPRRRIRTISSGRP